MNIEKKGKKQRGVEQVQARWGWYFVIPAIIFFSIFSFYPIINAFSLSFFKKNMISPLPPRFIGLGNYMYVLQSPDFWNSVRATLTFTIGTFIPLVVVSLLIAILITLQGKNFRLWQLLYYSPAVLSSAVAALIWMQIFTPTGIANQVVNTIRHTSGVDMRWLSSGEMVQFSTMIVYF